MNYDMVSPASDGAAYYVGPLLGTAPESCIISIPLLNCVIPYIKRYFFVLTNNELYILYFKLKVFNFYSDAFALIPISILTMQSPPQHSPKYVRHRTIWSFQYGMRAVVATNADRESAIGAETGNALFGI